ncbi:MAG: RagB/SusD family nutrient uptake outer membrane protein [Bacteroidales bacterium]|nr:RagB/SusD family nutrient uptake outer membrane protein [Bacteroidales bacterium]
MKLSNIFKGAMVGVLALSMASCQDFLNRPTEDNYNVDNFYKNDEQVEQGVNFLYNSPWYDFQRAFIKIGEVMSGNMYWGSSPYLTFTTNGTDIDLVNMSYSLWNVNGQANTVITNILNSEGPSQAAKNKAIGEALTWKAMSYFFMVRTFGEVPIVHDNNAILTSGTYNDLYKADRASVYEYIIMTLEKAMELLPKQTSGWNGRIDYYAAEGLLAKVYLTRAGLSGSLDNDDLAKAAQYAEDVILNSGRSLTPEYSDIFRLAPAVHNATGEHLIAWQWESTSGRWTAQNTLQSDLCFEGFSEFGDLWGGWGGPSYDLALAFGADPVLGPAEIQKVKDKRRQATLMMAGDVYPYFWTSKSTKTGNKGFDYLYFLYSGDAEYAAYGVPAQFEGPCGMQNVKHLFGDGADHEAALGFSAARMSYQLPTPLLRLADVYLICAEANLLAGNAAKALQYTNAVRERAGVEALASVKFEDVWKERRLELAGEGDRWYDYVRLAYYDKTAAMNDLKSQKMNSVYNYNTACKNYWYTGCGGSLEDEPEDLTAFDASKAEWRTTGYFDDKGNDNPVRYNDDDPARSTYVNENIFTLPLPSEDVVFNPHLLEAAQSIDVRTEYVYNF